MSSQLLDVPHKHPSSIWSFADNTLTLLREAVLTAGYVPLTTLAEKAVLSVLRNITIGRLRIVTRKCTFEFPARDTGIEEELCGELRVINDAFWVRLCTMGDLGFAEAYMFGDVACEDLVSTFLVSFLKEKDNLMSLNSTFSWLFSLPQRLTSFHASLGFSNHKIRQLLTPSPPSETTFADSNTLTSHTPSTWPTPTLADTLVAAQQRKLAHVIGSGWGSLALYIVRHIPDVQIDTITLSENQRAHVRAEVARQGLEDRIRVHLLDYREMPREWDGSFDRVVSVEMVEAVGLENVDVYWAAIDRVLKRKNAAGVIQGITIPEARFAEYSKQMDFIQKWLASARDGGRLVVDSISNIGPHYARTLREWRRQIEQALRKDHPGVFDSEQGADELAVFRRNCYCEIGFTTRMLGDHIITFTREGHEEMSCDVFE
ncbi:S-adenosyl-L-methionine-dependent methyltransferase [Russula vinacea]|nr:S-adenosyl-L-methionine-dependent methyltransferase [Russula vinacea]